MAATPSLPPFEQQGPELAVARLVDQVAGVVVGDDRAIRLTATTFVAGGHVLLEDIPGVGKTLLAKTMAASIGGTFGRVQGTPDLLPADLTGVSVYDDDTRQWTFRPGPLFHNVVLIDELNRATPRTQSALLEAMAEGQVTVDGTTHSLPDPFFVIATQNPQVGDLGAFPLVSGQRDRFTMSVSLGVPTREAEMGILRGLGGDRALDALRPVAELAQWRALRAGLDEIYVHDAVAGYVLDVVDAVRERSGARQPLSTRAALMLLRAARAHAVVSFRSFATPDDVQTVAVACLAHRITDLTNDDLPTARSWVAQFLAEVAVPPHGGHVILDPPRLAPRPDLTERGRRATRISPPAVAIVLLGLLSFILFLVTDNDAQLAVAVAIAVAVVTDGVIAHRSVHRVEVRGVAPIESAAAEPLAWSIAVQGVTRTVVVHPSGSARAAAVAAEVDGTATLFTPPVIRGIVDFGLFDVTARGPLGLIEAGRRVRVNLVHPVHVGPHPLPQPTEAPPPRAHHFGVHESTPVGEEMFRGLRDYVRGDARKRVDWKATARHRHLMVREHDGTGTMTLRVAVHLPARGAASEVAVARAAWLAEAALRQHWRVELIMLEPLALLPTPTFALGTPFGVAPRVPLQPPQPMHTTCRRVRNSHDVRARAGDGELRDARDGRGAWTALRRLPQRSRLAMIDSPLPAPPSRWVTPAKAPPERAEPLAQGLTLLIWVYALGVAGLAADAVPTALWAGAALTAGVVVGLATGIGTRFRWFSGWIAALVALVAAVAILAAVSNTLDGPLPWVLVVALPLFVRGLDWLYVPGLRAMTVLSGLLLVVALSEDGSWVIGAAVVWLVAVMGNLSLLEVDRRHSFRAATPASASPARSRTDLAATIALAIGCGVALALLVGSISLHNPFDADPPDLSSLPDSPVLAGQPPPEFRLDEFGDEQQIQRDGTGQEYIEQDGQRFEIERQGDVTTVRDPSTGNVICTIDGNGVTTWSDRTGAAMSWSRDADGQLFVEDEIGDRYQLGERDGQVVVTDQNGNIVARGGLADDHLYLLDDNGDVLVPGRDGDGRIPIPNAATRHDLLGIDEGRTVTSEDGEIVVRDAEGTRTHRAGEHGPEVVVDPVDGPTRTYAYEGSGSSMRIHELDREGNVIRSYFVDPNGVTVGSVDSAPVTTAAGDAPTSSTAPTSTTAPPDDDQGEDTPWWLLGAIVALLVAVGVIAWMLRRGRPPQHPADARSWAEDIEARIEKQGRVRGRGRRRTETVVSYSGSLQEVAPDHELASVGALVSQAFFAPDEPAPPARAWADGVIDQLEADQPQPRRRTRRRRH